MTRAETIDAAGREALAAVCAGSTEPADVRALARWLAARHPGKLIELRIPPFVAVQLGLPDVPGGHTRGTPPNVVEADPATFLGLATGRLSWREAREAHLVRASGSHSDIGALFPL